LVCTNTSTGEFICSGKVHCNQFSTSTSTSTATSATHHSNCTIIIAITITSIIILIIVKQLFYCGLVVHPSFNTVVGTSAIDLHVRQPGSS
jgi:hypothetical protein